MISNILPLNSVDVLLQVDGGPALLVDTIVADPGECGLTQIGEGLIDLGQRMVEYAERAA